jgi:hypothetical protein
VRTAYDKIAAGLKDAIAMSDLHDTLTRGGFRYDTHRAAVEAAAVDLAPGHLREPVAPISVGLATSVWSGGRKTVSEPPIEVFVQATHVQLIGFGFDHARLGLDAIYDAATRALATAGPLPLASTETWAESDQAYRARLADYLGCDVTYSGSMLDDYGVEAAELPRARLVPVITKESV